MNTRITIISDADESPAVNHAGCPPFNISDSFSSLEEQMDNLDDLAMNKTGISEDDCKEETTTPTTSGRVKPAKLLEPIATAETSIELHGDQTCHLNEHQPANSQEEQSSVKNSEAEQATEFANNTTTTADANNTTPSTGLSSECMDDGNTTEKPTSTPTTSKAVLVGMDESKVNDDDNRDLLLGFLKDFAAKWKLNQRMTIEELKTVFAQDLELEELVDQLKELGNDIVELEFDPKCWDALPQLLAQHADYLKAALNREPDQGTRDSARDYLNAALYDQPDHGNSASESTDLVARPGSCNEEAVASASNLFKSYQCTKAPCVYDSIEMSLGACAPMVVPAEPDTLLGLTAQHREFLQWLVRSQGLGFECVAPAKEEEGDRPAVLRVQLSDGTMATVRQDAVEQIEECNWV